MNIIATFAAGSSALFETAVKSAILFFNQTFSNNITVNLDFQESNLGTAGPIAQTEASDFGNISYSAIKSALTNNAVSSVQKSAASALPATNPFGSSDFYVNTAEAKALGIADSSGLDGAITLNSAYAYTFDPNNRSVSGEYDAIGSLEHEISEALGRVAGSDGTLTATPEALIRYSAPGTVDTSSSASGAYLSLDGGQSNLGSIGEPGGDLADWSSTSFIDAFGYATLGAALPVSSTDLLAMEALGYNLSVEALGSSTHVNTYASHPNDLNYAPLASQAVNNGTVNHFIDGLNYVASFSDLIKAFGGAGSAAAVSQDGTAHFHTSGINEHRIETFDGLDYIASYSDLIDALGSGGSALNIADRGAYHFIRNGHTEGRTISFNGLDYIASYSDLINAFGLDADAGALHYIQAGAKEGRTISFDGLDYIASYTDLMNAFGANEQVGAAHYITQGTKEGRTTSFNGLDYIASYTDLIQAFGANNDAGATHYIENGRREGRTVTFDGLAYIANYTDLMNAFGADEQAGAAHFINMGSKDGHTQTAFNIADYENAHPDLIGKFTTADQFLTAYITTYKTTGHFLT